MKNLKNLGKILNRNEQKAINGGVTRCMAKNHIAPHQACIVIGNDVLGCPRAEWCHNGFCSC